MLGGDCEVVMYVRVSTIDALPEEIDASIRSFQEQTLPQVRRLAGFEGAGLIVSRETGRMKALTYWSTREALESSSEAANRIRARVVEDAPSASVASVEVYEVAVQEGRTRLAEAA
jgi:heme-degrading monooxygenase HmoA